MTSLGHVLLIILKVVGRILQVILVAASGFFGGSGGRSVKNPATTKEVNLYLKRDEYRP